MLPEAAFPEAAAMIDFSHLMASLDQAKKELWKGPSLLLFRRFLDCFESVLSGVSFLWDDIFKEPLSSKLLDLSHVPEPVCTQLVDWIDFLLPEELLCGFVTWSFGYIVDSVNHSRWMEWEGGEPIRKSNVTIFFALAMVLRSKPYALAMGLSILRKKQLSYRQTKGIVNIPLTVWMITQASQHDLHAGLYSWAHNLLPTLVGSNAQSRDLILLLVEK